MQCPHLNKVCAVSLSSSICFFLCSVSPPLCHTWLCLRFIAKLRIWQVPACKCSFVDTTLKYLIPSVFSPANLVSPRVALFAMLVLIQIVCWQFLPVFYYTTDILHLNNPRLLATNVAMQVLLIHTLYGSLYRVIIITCPKSFG